MKIVLESLTLLCRGGEERIRFSCKLSFFHGEMSTGKSTIVEMVNFCFGGRLVRTPAVTSELVGVQLVLTADDTEILIERGAESTNRVDVTWKYDGGRHLASLPLSAESEPVVGEDIFNLSDFLLRAVGIPLLKVRKSKSDGDSEMQRVSFRDFYKFVYLDQDDLDSSFFLLETPIRQEKSKDVLRYVLGLHSDELVELEIRLSEIRQKQREIRQSARDIDEFLGRYGFNSEAQIEEEIHRLDIDAATLKGELESITPSGVPSETVSEERVGRIRVISDELDARQQALRDVDEQIRDQESLASELLSLKFKIARSVVASRVLERAEFHMCPACGSTLTAEVGQGNCVLCHSDLHKGPRSPEMDSAVMERDLSERVEDLERSLKRLRTSRESHGAAVARLLEVRGELQKGLDSAKESQESQYMQRIRTLESKLGGVIERRQFLRRVKAMPSEIEVRRKAADKMSEEIDLVERKMVKEQERFEAGRMNVAELEQTFHSVLLAIHFPGITTQDKVYINTKTWLPYIAPSGNQERAWSFSDAGSGGKKVLFKICFALALHVTAARRNLPLPRLLIIDSTMKNITPDINREIVKYFYDELYRLLASELEEWQFVLVDQTYFAPKDDWKLQVTSRRMTKDDPNNPPLISYYNGH